MSDIRIHIRRAFPTLPCSSHDAAGRQNCIPTEFINLVVVIIVAFYTIDADTDQRWCWCGLRLFICVSFLLSWHPSPNPCLNHPWTAHSGHLWRLSHQVNTTRPWNHLSITVRQKTSKGINSGNFEGEILKRDFRNFGYINAEKWMTSEKVVNAQLRSRWFEYMQKIPNHWVHCQNVHVSSEPSCIICFFNEIGWRINSSFSNRVEEFQCHFMIIANGILSSP